MLNYLDYKIKGEYKMKKSELREMIREILKEELSKNHKLIKNLEESTSKVKTKIFAFNHDEPEHMKLFVDVPLHLIEKSFDHTLDMSNKNGLWLVGNTDEEFQYYDLSNFKSISDADAWCYNEFKKQITDGEDFVCIEDPIFCEFDATDIADYKTPIANMLTWEVDGDSTPTFYAMDMTTLTGDLEAYNMDDFNEFFLLY